MKWLKKWQTAVVLFCCALLHLFGDGAKAENGLYTQTSARVITSALEVAGRGPRSALPSDVLI